MPFLFPPSPDALLFGCHLSALLSSSHQLFFPSWQGLPKVSDHCLGAEQIHAGQLSPCRTCTPGQEIATSGSRLVFLVYPHSFSNAFPYYLTFSSSFSLPPPSSACCACFFLSLLLFPSFPFCFFPPSSCFLNQFQIDIKTLFSCFVDQGLGGTSFLQPFPP